MRRCLVLFFVFLNLVFFNLGRAQVEIKGIVPGDGLGWEIKDVKMLLSVGTDSFVKLEIYSPGFDPDDYRAALKGLEELGDENYDPASRLEGEFRLSQGEQVVARAKYAVEQHQWVSLFEGELKAGAYTLSSRFFGNAKNAYIYRLTSPNQSAVSLSYADGLKLFDVRGRDWQKGFEVSLPAEALPARYALYDGDGETELEAKVVLPNGSEKHLEVSGKLAWETWEFNEPGNYQIFFRIPKTATQYSNTVAFQEVFPAPVTVEVVDTALEPLNIPYTLTGYSLRDVDLGEKGKYQLLKVEADGGEALSETHYQFGYEGGHIRYILGLPIPLPKPLISYAEPAKLTIKSVLRLPAATRPYALGFSLNGETKRLNETGEMTLEVPAGTYSLTAGLKGARVVLPEPFILKAAEAKTVVIEIYPQVALSLEAEPRTLYLGESSKVRAVASTDFADLLPSDLFLDLPEGWRSSSAPRLTSPISATRSALLELEVWPDATGVYPVADRLEPWGLSKSLNVTVLEPARLSLSKTLDKASAQLGDTVTFNLEVSNSGQADAKDVELQDSLPAGLSGQNLDTVFDLPAGESRSFQVPATVVAGTEKTVTNTAKLIFNEEVQESSASLEVLLPEPKLERSLNYTEVLPSEKVVVTLTVSNTGQARLNFQVTDTPPEWLELLGSNSFSGELEPGESQTYSYEAQVRFGPEVSAQFEASLVSNGGSLTNTAALKRKLIPLEKVASAAVLLEGESVSFIVRVSNPLTRPITLDLRESPDAGLNLEADSLISLAFTPLERKELSFTAKPSQTGDLLNEVSVFLGTTPVSFPAQASVLVKPALLPERLSTIRLPFTVEASQGDLLLVRHEEMPGSQYQEGSSRLNGEPLADPKRLVLPDGETEHTYLFWELPFAKTGLLSYTLRHQAELAEIAEPSLTLQVGARELYLQGKASFADLTNAVQIGLTEREGLIREPLAGTIYRLLDQAKVVLELKTMERPSLLLNGEVVSDDYLGKLELDQEQGIQRLEYYGLPLIPGENKLELSAAGQYDTVTVWRALNPTKLAFKVISGEADGVSPVRIEVQALDDYGLSNGFGALSLETNLEPLDEDAFPDMSGYQLLLKDGRAVLNLRPVSYSQPVKLKAQFNDLKAEFDHFLGGADATLYQYQGVITASFDRGEFALEAEAKAYLETPFLQGSLQGALDSSGNLAKAAEDLERFPLTGSGQDAQAALQSDDLIALRYDDPQFSVGYYRSSLDLPGLNLGTATALQAEARLEPYAAAELGLKGFAALMPESERVELISPDGTRFYLVKGAKDGIKRGSETLTVITGAQRRKLIPFKDYTLNYETGALILIAPLYATNPQFPGQEVLLEVHYQLQNEPRTQLSYGMGVSYNLEHWQFGLAAAEQKGLKLAAYANYQDEGLNFKTQYRYDDQGLSQLNLDIAYTYETLVTSLNLSYNRRLQGQARLALGIAEGQAIALEHSTSLSRNQTNALYELNFEPLKFGLGLAYLWEANSVNAVARMGYSANQFGIDLTHTQALNASVPSLSQLNFSYKVSETLTADLNFDYLWGATLSGSLGLVQTLGSSTLALTYQLPGSDGKGNRARFGVETPISLTEELSLNVAGTYEHDFSQSSDLAQGSLALKYQTEGLTASSAAELSIDTQSDSELFKLTYRGGISGQLDHQQSLSFDVNYQLIPDLEGDFTLSYALRGRDLSLLSYHRLTTGSSPILEGEFAPTLHLANNWQLRPGISYKFPLDNPIGTTYLASLGGHYYLNSQFGLGGAVYHEWQPGTSSNATAISFEGSMRMLDDLWMVAGYTINGFDGLSSQTKNGLYLRLELFGGNQ